MSRLQQFNQMTAQINKEGNVIGENLKQHICQLHLHLHSLLQVPALKARLKLKREACLIKTVGALNGLPASSST